MSNKKLISKKKYSKPTLKIIRLKDVDFKPAMIIFWRGHTQWTYGNPCAEG